jgi:hypothetical protein
MPPQKNSGNKKGRRETGASVKNRQFIGDLMSDLRQNNHVDDVYLGRVTRKLGNGRVEVFYVASEKEKTFDEEGNEIEKYVSNSYQKQATIKGSFRGKGKHSVWIDVGSAVVVADAGLGQLMIMAVLTRDQLQDIASSSHVDERILKEGVFDGNSKDDDAIVFDNQARELSDGDIDDI